MLVSRLERARCRRGYGRFWPCCCDRTNVTVQTSWCNSCVAPGTITVTITSGSCPGGGVAASGAADASGNFACQLAAGTYCASASTSQAGYTNTVSTFTVPSSGSVAVQSPLYPASVTITDSLTGQDITATPTGTYTLLSGPLTASPIDFIGTSTVTFTGCTSCTGTVTIYYEFKCDDPLYGAPSVTVTIVYTPVTDPTSGCTNDCPSDSGTSGSAYQVKMTSGQLCYPLSLSGSYSIPACFDPTCGCSAAANLYNACTAGKTLTFGVTQ